MNCKKCGNEIDKKWIVCPICSNKLKRKYQIPLIIGIIFLCLIYVFVDFNFFSNEDNKIDNYLEKKYNKEFDSIKFIKSKKKPDTTMSCDGADFGTIKGRGNTKYFLGYSKEDDIEFTVFYDTFNKEVSDTYDYRIKLRKHTVNLYEFINNSFINNIEEITLEYDIYNDLGKEETINNIEHLYKILSKVEDVDLDGQAFTTLYVFIDINAFEFARKEYEKINKLNNSVIKFEEDIDGYLSVDVNIYTADNILIEFNKNGDVRIYDEFYDDKAWGETIEEFIERKSY